SFKTIGTAACRITSTALRSLSVRLYAAFQPFIQFVACMKTMPPAISGESNTMRCGRVSLVSHVISQLFCPCAEGARVVPPEAGAAAGVAATAGLAPDALTHPVTRLPPAITLA